MKAYNDWISERFAMLQPIKKGDARQTIYIYYICIYIYMYIYIYILASRLWIDPGLAFKRMDL